MTGTNSAERYEAELVLEMAKAIEVGDYARVRLLRSMVETSMLARLGKIVNDNPENDKDKARGDHENNVGDKTARTEPE